MIATTSNAARPTYIVSKQSSIPATSLERKDCGLKTNIINSIMCFKTTIPHN